MRVAGGPVPGGARRALARGLVLLALLLIPAAAGSDQEAGDDPAARLAPRYQRWLEDVDLLLSDLEREVFLALTEDYQRDHFIRRFWRVRDPFRQTARNELMEAWQQRAAAAREEFENVTGTRAQMMLTFGAPSRRNRYTCSVLRPLEVWEYDEGSDRVRGYFTLVFVGLHTRSSRSDLWEPGWGLSRLFTTGRSFGAGDRQLAQTILGECIRGDDILAALGQALDLSRLKDQHALLPRPSEEWVRTFQARTTNVADDAERLRGELVMSFPGRHQSRTVVQGRVTFDKSEVAAAEVGGYRSYNLLVDGEILRKGELFDHFRYRFDFPADKVREQLPLVVQRYLRPGEYQLILKVEDLASRRVFREEVALVVPRVARATAAAAPVAAVAAPPAVHGAPASRGAGAGEGLAGPSAGGAVPLDDPLAEANASISTGDHTIQILALPEVLTVGQLRVHANVRGDGIARVAFELDGRPVMRKSRPPYSVELNLGQTPRTHELRAVALDAEGRTLATDEVTVNAGPHRFDVRLLEPQSGKRYRSSVRAHAEVEVPEGERLEKLEIYLDETLLATLYQPPFEQPILLDGEAKLSYVRAVAHLMDGSTAEDVRVINAPDFMDSLKVHFVELYTTVVDRAGEFVEDLALEELTVLEDGEPQRIRRFETMRDLPIRAGLVIDTSTSMTASLGEVKKAAHRFFESVLTERDRAALITFNDAPQLVVRFTRSQEVLAGGLTGLVAEGETALYDTVIFALHYFSGLRGKRAIVILTDGEDSSSTYGYDEAIDFARRTGVAIYIVGLRLSGGKTDVRMKMQRLAHDTGGECFFIERASQLERVYDSIQQELRSQYLIAYQSSAEGGDGFREVEVKVDRKGLEAKTIRGYFP